MLYSNNLISPVVPLSLPALPTSLSTFLFFFPSFTWSPLPCSLLPLSLFRLLAPSPLSLQIALLQLTVQKFNSVMGKPPKGMGDMMKTARQNFADHITDKLTVARRQNEQVYHDTFPPVESLELT